MDETIEWFCSECTAVKQKAKKRVREQKADDPPTTGDQTASAEIARKDYFNSLTKENMVDLLMQASMLAPNLSLWPAPPPPPPRAVTAPMTGEAYPTPENESNDPEDDYDEYEDGHSRLYPKPGNGVQLPPENEDLHLLLEGPESRTFSHTLGDGVAGAGGASAR
jgi:hypothetical protein